MNKLLSPAGLWGILKAGLASLRRRAASTDLLIWAPILIYAITFSHYTLQKHYLLNSYAWDLGVFNQALYTTLFHGKLLFYTADLFMNELGSYFAIHFSPILFLIMPFYAVYPAPETLLVMKSIIMALGALPLYALAKETLRDNRFAFIIATLYLLHPAVQGANWFDFQPQIFIPVTVFSSAYFLLKQRWRSYLAMTALSLTISEHTTLLILLLSVYYLLTSDLRRIPQLFRRPQLTRESATLLSTALCIAFLGMAEYVKGLFPIKPDFLDVYRASKAYEVLGFGGGSLFLLPLYVIANPGKALEALLYDYQLKLLYVIFLFAPLAFTPFGSKMSIVAALLLAPFMLSNLPQYYKIGGHWPLYIITPIFMAAVDSLSTRTKRDVMATIRVMIISSLIFIVSTSPISPISQPLVEQNILWYPKFNQMDGDVKMLHDMLRLVPKDEPILTQNNLFPHISSRINAYVLPLGTYPPKQTMILENYTRNLLNEADFVLLDLRKRDYWTMFVLNEIRNSEVFGVYASATRIVLFKKNYSGPPVMTPELSRLIFIASKDLICPRECVVKDESSESIYVVFNQRNSTQRTVVYGPYICLLPGTYEVTYLVKVGQHSDGFIGVMDVVDELGAKVLARRCIYGFELEENVWSNITMRFMIREIRTNVEFRLFSSGNADLYIDRVIVSRVSSEAEKEFGTMTFNYEQLVVRGKMTWDGIMLYPSGGNYSSRSFWYGPYVSLQPGRYRASFFIKVSPEPDENDKIITLDVVSDFGRNVVARLDLYGRSLRAFEAAGSGWSRVTLEFTVEGYLEKVEFRGLNPLDKYDIYLAFILIETRE